VFKELSKKDTSSTEKEISKYWEDIDIIHETVNVRKDCPNFVFYEGPPTANGAPGIHHVIARTLKDSVNKYHTMRGYRIIKKAGWDTHGLPVEIEVEKMLGMSGKQDIEKYGIAEFNKKCRESVFKYEALWRDMTKRMGYFIDLDDPYITLDNKYIESVWWILNQFYKKGLIYEGHKILPYCPRCGTGLASHEVAQGYQNIKTDTVVIKVKRKDADEYFLAWTTTPWTLASNVALAVNPKETYAKVAYKNKTYILAQPLIKQVLENDDYEVLETFCGKELEYAEYERIMPFVPIEGGKAFFVVCADFVTMEDGTGIVHIAPAFGEDDYNAGKEYGLAVPNPVNESGHYTATPWAGKFVMEADPEIILWLKENGKLFKKKRMEHNYPHCWRCKTPLLYYAKPSWYIRVTDYKDKLIAANNKVNWFPDFIGEKRFGNWLENLKDWAISRNRYWGTPLNIWRCACGHTDSIGSIDELKERAIEIIDGDIELHRPYVDDIHLKCPECGGVMTRVKDVIDCWFDSGSMPFAQYHYPFENKDLFEDQFPADFICEGIDQTRGWFYSLLTIGTFIKGISPYKNVLVNDLILDADGQKMSKSRGNTVNPFDCFDKYGADALRWYLLYVSPAWTPTKFDENGLKEIISKFFNTLKNIYTFFALYTNADDVDPRTFYVEPENRDETDRWLLSRFNIILKEVIDANEAYDMTKAVRLIQDFVNEDFSNWYIRRNRRRFWGSDLTADKKSVLNTTYEILVGVVKIAAPYAPYITEEIYRNLTGEKSVHLSDYPKPEEALIDMALEEKMQLVRNLVSLGRKAREEAQIKVRQPLRKILVDAALRPQVSEITDLIKEELNVKEVVFEEKLSDYINYSLKPDFKVSGKLFGAKVKQIAAYLAQCDAADFIAQLHRDGSVGVIIDGENILLAEELLDIRINAKEGFNVQTDDNLFVILDTELTPELIDEGYARELISKVQQMRKNLDFDVSDRIRLWIDTSEPVKKAVEAYEETVKTETLTIELDFRKNDGEKISLNDREAVIYIERI
jgi:isoleucyl-tRNA synthetase